MYYNLIKNYIGMLSIEDIRKFSNSEGIILTKYEEQTIYEYLKNYWETFYSGDPTQLLKELKLKLSSNVYEKLELLYYKTKEQIN